MIATTDNFITVVPAKAGIQRLLCKRHWIPAFAGMTVRLDERRMVHTS